MNKKWFTLIEVVVAMTIIVILSAISFISYASYLTSARDSQRVADLAQISSALELFIKENNRLPEAAGWNWKSTDNTGSPLNRDNVFKQWYMDGSELNTLKKVPLDPKTEARYVYSKIIFEDTATGYKANPEFQVAATLEWWNKWAIISGNYYPVTNRFPSIILVGDIIDKNYFVLDWKDWNTAYTISSPHNPAHKENTQVEDSYINSLIRHPYKTCKEIKNAWKYIWNIDYTSNDWTNITANNCD